MDKNKFEIFTIAEQFEERYPNREDTCGYPRDKGSVAAILQSLKDALPIATDILSYGFPKEWGTASFRDSSGYRKILVTFPKAEPVYGIVVSGESDGLLGTCGFSIGMSDDNFSIQEWERETGKVVTSEKLTADAMLIESRMLEWLDYRYGSARDEGHDSDNERIGTLFVYHNLDEIEEIADGGDPRCQSSGSWYEPEGLWEGLNYPDMWWGITLYFYDLKKDSPTYVYEHLWRNFHVQKNNG